MDREIEEFRDEVVQWRGLGDRARTLTPCCPETHREIVAEIRRLPRQL